MLLYQKCLLSLLSSPQCLIKHFIFTLSNSACPTLNGREDIGCRIVAVSVRRMRAGSYTHLIGIYLLFCYKVVVPIFLRYLEAVDDQ